MGFMQLMAEHGDWYVVETSSGTYTIPEDVVGEEPYENIYALEPYVEGEPESFELKTGWCAHYSAPGYLDQTDWMGPYETEEEALKECQELYGDEEGADE
jgi:hypothetical protein